MSALPVLLVPFSCIMKLMRLPGVVAGFNRLGVPEKLTIPVGLIELTCGVVYLIPRTSVLGAILMTGLLGGAPLTTLRVGLRYVLSVVLGMLAWGGLWMWDLGLRARIPLLASKRDLSIRGGPVASSGKWGRRFR